MSRAIGPTTVLYSAWAPFFSGAERALLVLLDHLDRTRYRPVVAIGTDGQLAAELRSRQVPTVRVPMVYLTGRTLPAWSAAVARLAWLARRTGAALFHANDVPSFQPAGYASRLLRRPVLVHVRFPDTAAGFPWFLKPGFTKALFISASMEADSLAAAPGLFAGRSEVVYDGVQIPPEERPGQRAGLRARVELPPDRTIVALVGQVAEIKGLWDFIDAAALTRDQAPDALFVIVGDDLKGKGALRAEAEARVRTRGLSDRVRFLGFRSDAHALMPAFDIVAAPSHVEPLGLSALEAMAAGRPVVASRVGGLVETIVHDATGLLVPPADPRGLADAILSLAADPGRRAALGDAGRRRVIDRFSVAAHAAGVQAVYDRVLRRA